MSSTRKYIYAALFGFLLGGWFQQCLDISDLRSQIASIEERIK